MDNLMLVAGSKLPYLNYWRQVAERLPCRSALFLVPLGNSPKKRCMQRWANSMRVEGWFIAAPHVPTVSRDAESPSPNPSTPSVRALHGDVSRRVRDGSARSSTRSPSVTTRCGISTPGSCGGGRTGLVARLPTTRVPPSPPGAGLRPGSISDANDEAQCAELKMQGGLNRFAWEHGAQVINDCSRHILDHPIKKNMDTQLEWDRDAPFSTLGLLASDLAPSLRAKRQRLIRGEALRESRADR